MATFASRLSLAVLLAAAPLLPLAQANAPDDSQEGVSVDEPAPEESPPSPPSAKPAAPPAQARPQASVPPGQWVYTQQYGWVWMPYGDAYTYAPPDGYGEPYMYVYYPVVAGWTWVYAPWVWGWGPWPFFGFHGPVAFAWYGHGWWRTPWRWHGVRPAPFHGGGVRGFAFRGAPGMRGAPGHFAAPAGHFSVGHVGGARVGGGGHAAVRAGGHR